MRGLERGRVGFCGLRRNVFGKIKRASPEQSAVGIPAEDETAAGGKLLEQIGNRM